MQIAPWVFPLTEETASVPPRVRGKGVRRQRCRIACGITPACAGKSGILSCSTAARRGSPPRVRGKAKITLREAVPLRITPACAGKRQVDVAQMGIRQDHPRVCGEKRHPESKAILRAGSPPRVRGKVDRGIATVGPFGITPACAGKSRLGHRSRLRGRDHPRVCGEKGLYDHGLYPYVGSPPRVRGKVNHTSLPSGDSGITPACAGKRTRHTAEGRVHRDHPRVCGEKSRPSCRSSAARGSPPRVRGKAAAVCNRDCHVGITPACAGKSPLLPVLAASAWDHPRVCGEKSTI